MCKIQTKLQHSFSEMVLKLVFHSVIFLLFQERSLFKGRESIYFVFTSVCPHLLVPGNPHGLNKKEFSASSSVLVGIGTANSVQITNLTLAQAAFLIFLFYTSFVLHTFFLGPSGVQIQGHFVCLVFFKLFLHAVVFP